MRTPEKKKTNNVRSLKIQPQTRFNRWSRVTVPEITLCGNWLQELGFAPEKRVSIVTKKGMLVIRLDE